MLSSKSTQSSVPKPPNGPTSVHKASQGYILLKNSVHKGPKFRGGGYFHQNRTWMCLPDLENLTISIPNFCLISYTHQYTIFERKAPNFDQIGCFLQYLAQNTPNLCILGSFVSDENPPIAIPNFTKKAPQKAGTYTYTMSMWGPPGPKFSSGPFTSPSVRPFWPHTYTKMKVECPPRASPLNLVVPDRPWLHF